MKFRGLLLALTLAPSIATAGEWKKTREVDGITVSKKVVEGSPVVAFKGEGDVEAPLDVVSTIIFDTTRATEWIADLRESRIVRWTGSDTFIEYDHAGTPFILKDRDFLSTVTLETDRHAQVVKFNYANTTDAAVPPNPRFVRGDLMSTVFTLTKLDDKKTHVVAEIHIDPKGAIPTFIVNWVQSDWPEQTFRGLRKQAKKDIRVEPYFRNALVE